jgi:hypothetical protein
MGGAAGTHLLQRRRNSPVAFPFCATAVFLADDAADPFLDCAATAFRSRNASVLSSSRAAAAACFSSFRSVPAAACR